MANRWENIENSDRLYFLGGLQNHCRWSLSHLALGAELWNTSRGFLVLQLLAGFSQWGALEAGWRAQRGKGGEDYLPLASFLRKGASLVAQTVPRPDVLSHFSRVRLFETLWTLACQAPLSMGFSRQEYWSGLPCPLPGDLPDSGIIPSISYVCLHWQAGSLPLVPANAAAAAAAAKSPQSCPTL